MFIVEDSIHIDDFGDFDSFAAAVNRLDELSRIPWDQPPNDAPCTSWRTCGRRYEITEYDTSTTPWRVLNRTPTLNVSASGVEWMITAP